MLALPLKSSSISSWQKLHLDFVRTHELRGRMDDDTRELIDQLCTQVGITMEDGSVLALTSRTIPADQLCEQMDTLLASAAKTYDLIKAARSLCK